MKTYIPTKTWNQMFLALFISIQYWKQPKCQSTSERINKMSYSHTVERYSAIKSNALQIHAMT